MKRSISRAATLAVLYVSAAGVHAASFNYHGNLQDAGRPAEGSYDLELTLYSAAEGGHITAGPLLLYRVPVHDGSFSTEADFGPLANAAHPSWLGVKVRNAGGGDFAAMSARAPVAADATASNSSCPGSWSLDGNAGNAADSFLGTADAKDVVVKSNNQNVLVAPAAAQGAVALSGSITAAAGAHSTAVSDAYAAKGAHSFAGGFSGGTNFHGSFVWGDDAVITEVVDSAPNQFVMRAGGGAGINGVPKDASTELSIYPSAYSGGDYSEIFMGQRTLAEGILLTAGNASAGNNDSSFYIDEYDGTDTYRLLQAGFGGLVLNPQNLTSDGGLQFKIAVNTFTEDAGLELHANVSDGTYYGILENFGGNFLIEKNSGFALEIHKNSDFEIFSGNAYKIGGGSWATSSDRRIKQDVVPISSAVDTLLRLRPISFHYTPEYLAQAGGLENKRYLGFVAQEFAEVFPEAVTSTGKQVPGARDGDPPILALDPNPALITTVAAVQELAVDNAEMRQRLDAANAGLLELRERLSRLECKEQ